MIKADDYQYPLSQCDVPIERRPALEAYRAKRHHWLAWLDTDEHPRDLDCQIGDGLDGCFV
jgi:hypothetical protein